MVSYRFRETQPNLKHIYVLFSCSITRGYPLSVPELCEQIQSNSEQGRLEILLETAADPPPLPLLLPLKTSPIPVT